MVQKNTIKDPIIKTFDLTIQFGDFLANDSIFIDFYPGEIHSICGENGAGKSTLMKMLYGVYKPTRGKIMIYGEEVILTPAKAIAYGIGMVFQDFRLIPAFSALENIRMALPKNKKMSSDAIRKEIIEISGKYQIPIDPDMFIWEMDLGQRQRVEIIKVMMMGDMKVLIFDEPTSVLTQHEANAFIEMLKKLRDDGLAIVLITHKLKEVIACSDTISILRHGILTCKTRSEDGFDKDILIAQMMGEDTYETIDYSSDKKEIVHPSMNMSIKSLTVLGEHGRKIIKDVNLDMMEGEIVGVAGISGRGQRELMETLFGLKKAYSGSIRINGKDISQAKVDERMNLGMAFISEDPKRDNVVSSMNIKEHFLLGGILCKTKHMGIDWKTIKRQIEQSEVVKELGVPQVDRNMGTLSGGNIQRVVLARAVMKNPKVLLASYPSRGLDVGTVAVVHKTLLEMRNQGSSILLISEDLDELLKISDSIIIISDNRILGKFNPNEITPSQIGEIMIGGGADDKK